MKRLTLRIEESMQTAVEQYCANHGILNMQEGYRRLILSGLSIETKFDKKKTINFEEETIKELKVITNILSKEVTTTEETNKIREQVSGIMNNIQIVKK